MSGKLVSRLFFVFALSALITAVGGNPASAANYYFDQNGATAGDGITNGATYTWTTNAAATDWSNANVAGTGPMVAWTTGNTNVAYFGGVTGDAPGWFYNVNVDSTIGSQKGGINVGSVSSGTVTLQNGTSTPNFNNSAAVSWTMNNGATLIDNINASSNGAVNLNNNVLTLGGSGNVIFGSAGTGLDHETSTLTDSLTGTLSLLSSARTSFDTTSTFNWTFGTLAIGNAFGPGSAKFNIGSGTSSGLVLTNVSGAAMTLSSTGSPITINSSFTYGGANNFSFPTAALSTVTLNTTPTITVASNTLAFPQSISGATFGVNMVGPGTLALTANNTFGGAVSVSGGGLLSLTGGNQYTGGTTITSGTVSLGAAGSLGSGDVSVQAGGVLNASVYSGALSLGGSLIINGGALDSVGQVNVAGGLGLTGGTLNYPSGTPTGPIAVTGNATLSGVNYVVPGALLSSGTYALITYPASGLTGGAANLAMGGPYIVNGSRQTYSFDTSTGLAVNLVVNGSAGNLQWVGGANSTWDTLTSQNWLNSNGGTLDYFYPADNVTFNDSPGTATAVNINGTVQPASVTVSNLAENYTFSGTGSITGGGSLTMNGQDALTINNSNAYSGGTFLSSGLLNIGNANALGTGPLAISGGSIDNTSGGSLTLAGNAQNWSSSFIYVGSFPLNTGTGAVTLANSPTVTVNAGTLTVGGGMSGASGLTIGGTGLFLSTAANSYTGATTIGGGTMQLGTGQAGLDGSLATSGAAINSALVYDIAGNQTAGYPFTGAGSLTKLGTGTLTLSVSSTGFTGPTSVNAGILAFTAGGGNGTLLKSPIVVASGGTLLLNSAGDNLGYNAGGASVTIFGAMIKTGAESETLARFVTLSGGTMNATATQGAPNGSWDLEGPGPLISTAPGTTNFIMGSGTTENISARAAGAYFNIGQNSTLTVSVPFLQNNNSGSSPNVNIVGQGNMIFSGNNFYGSGGTAVVINVGYSATSGTAGNLVLAGSLTFPITTAGSDTSAPADRNDGYFNVGYGSTLLISNSANATVAGDLNLGAYAAGSSGTANQTGGTLAVTGVDTANGSRSLVIGEFGSETSAFNLSAGSLSVPNGWTYLGYSGSGVLNISGGTATLLGINLSGQGGAVNLSGNGLLSIGSSGISNNGPASSATLSGGTLQSTASWNTNVPMTLGGPATVGLQGNTLGFNGTISGPGSLAFAGAGGTLLLGGSNSYNGGTTVPSGFIVRAGNNNALGTGLLYLNGGIVSSSGASAYSLASPLVLGGAAGTLGDAVNTGALTFTAASGTLASNTSLTVNSNVTISGGLTDGGSGFTFAKNGPGSLTLAGNNTYSGSTSVNAGGLYLNGTNATPYLYVSSQGTLGGAGSAASTAVTVDYNPNTDVGGVLDLSQNAASTLTLGSLTFNGFGTINMALANSNTSVLALQAGALSMNGFGSTVGFVFPHTLLSSGTYRLLGVSGALTAAQTNDFFIQSPPQHSVRQTAPVLTFQSNEVDLTVAGFTPYWNGQQPDWQSTSAWTLNPGGSLTTFEPGDNDVFDDTAGSGAYGTNVGINTGNVNPISVMFNSSTSAYTISGSNGITGPAFMQINITGSGSLTINNSNGYTGGTQFNGGVLNLGNSSALGNGPLSIAGGTLGNISGGPIALAGITSQAWNGSFTFSGPNNLNLGTGPVTLSGNRTLNLAAGTLTVGGPINGSGASLNVTGVGGLVLGGANSYNSGTFILGSNNVTATDNNSPLGSGPVSMAPTSGTATLALTGTAASIGALTMSPTGAAATASDIGTAASISSLAMTPNNGSATLTFGGSATGPVTMSPNIGSATLTLSGMSVATGALTISPTGAIAMVSDNGSAATIGALTMTPNNGSATLSFAGATIGPVAVNPNNGSATVTLLGTSATTGAVSMSPTNVSDTATLNVTGATATIGGLSNSGAGASMIVLGNTAAPAASTLIVNNGTASTFSGTIGDLSQTNPAAAGSLVFNGPATLNLSGSNTYTGSTTITGGTLQLGSSSALYAGAGVGNAIVNGALDLGGYNANVGGLSGAGTVLSSVSGAGVLTAGNNNASSTYAGTIAATVQGLVKTGAGSLLLTGPDNALANTLSSGTLQVGNGGLNASIANVPAVINGAFIVNIGADTTAPFTVTMPAAGVTGTGTIAVATAATNPTGAADPGAIVLLGNVTTGGSQSYIASETSVARANGIMIGDLNSDTATTVVLTTTAAGSSITLTGNVGQNHATTPQNLVLDTSAVNGTINLNVSIGYAGEWFSPGAFTANAGTGAINWTGTYGNGENQATPISLTGAINFASSFAAHSALTMTLNPTEPSTVSGVFSGPMSVVAGGPSILTVTSSNTYTGSTTINGGVLQLGTGVTGQDGSIASTSGVIDNAALVYDVASTLSPSYAISGTGTVTKTGTGTVVLGNGANSYNGGTFVNSGVLQLGSATALGTSGVAANGGTLDLAGFSVTLPSFSGAQGTVTSSVALASTATVNQLIATSFGGTFSDGAGTLALEVSGGTLTLSGTGAYTGGTYVDGAGNLIVTNPQAIDIHGVGTNLFVGDGLGAFGTVQSVASAVVPAGVASAVPEPGTMALLAAAATALVIRLRRKTRTETGSWNLDLTFQGPRTKS